MGSRARPVAPRAAGLLAVALAACAAPPAPPAPRDEVFHGETMGTTYTVRLDRPLDAAGRTAVAAAIARELALVDERMSLWRPDSELSRFNAHRDTAPVTLSPETFEVLVEADRVTQITGGAFDVTVGPLVEAYGFGAHGAAAPPPPAELARLRSRVGWRLLRLDPIEGSAAKAHPDLEVDLDAIAPGYAVDRIARALDELGHTDYMVEIGGEVRARGENAAGEAWQIGIERPLAERRELQRIVPLADSALATSGDYRNFRVVAGRRLTHIVDPRSGEPLRHALASATVLHASCTTADALATALMVLGPDEGMALAEREDLAVLLLVRDDDGAFVERASPAWQRRVPLVE